MAINVGDVYFIGYFGNGTGNAGAGNPSGEGFAILVKNPIAGGETLNFTDNALQSSGAFSSNEQSISFTVPSGGIAANSILQFPLNGANQTTVYRNNDDGTRTAIGTITPTGNTGLSNSGDQLFAYQGTLAAPTVLAGVDVSTNSPITTGATTTNSTYAPASGVPFLDFPQGSNNVQISIDPRTATPAQLQDTSNYTQNIATTTNPETSFAALCFATGARIRTSRGDVAVEDLAVGDVAITRDGRRKIIRWIGHRLTHCDRHPQPGKAWPVRVQAGTFGEGLPYADLWLSPGHALCLDDALVPVRGLIDGSRICQVQQDSVTYWHVEVDGHDVLLANGLPAESYLDTGNRRAFDNAGATALHFDEDAGAGYDGSGYCLPLVESGPRLSELRLRYGLGRVASEAAAPPSEVHLAADGLVLMPRVIGENELRFLLPAGTGEVRLVSPSFAAAGPDIRRLGVIVGSLAVSDGAGWRAITLDDSGLYAGFHEIEVEGERIWRWTDGEAHLSARLWKGLTGDALLRVTGVFTGLRPTEAADADRRSAA